MDALRITDLKKKYRKGPEALKGVDLTVKKGEFFGLLGPNGAGKSTLIHCVTGLAVPTSGEIKVFGKDSQKEYQAARQAVGLSPQEVMSLDWFLNVEETLDYHGGYYGMPRKQRQRRVDELLKSFSLEDKRKASVRALSGGMRRRLVIARALMHKPKMLILDEPTAGVDVELRLELWHYMKRVNKQGTTILLTTHYIEEAEQLASRVALINHGEIVDIGTVAELKKKHKKKTLEDVYLAVVGREELARTAKADAETDPGAGEGKGFG
ncbi:MAG: ABC transporter ATP-binding protein [bacterium]|nr:ABC transporter ATP-binding protein [bacterium]MDZ4248157.1 ABC transporter ATP-binding protein [Patescibacteria group bacterium]